jgi:multisubunit Na+/H+ antiporter MnhG subunit
MMEVKQACIAFLLGAAVASAWLSAWGVLWVRGTLGRLHYVGLASVLVPVLVGLAVLLDASSLQASIKGVMVMLILIFTTPVVTHATARAVFVREMKGQGPTPDHDEKSEAR